MDPIERRRQELAWAEKRREQALDRIFTGQASDRQATIKQVAERYEAAEAERVAAAEKAAVAAHEQDLREKLRLAYVAASGSEAGFSEQYPALRSAFVQAQTLAGATGAKSEQAVDIAKRFLRLAYGG